MAIKITKEDLIATKNIIRNDTEYLFDFLDDMIKDTWNAKTSVLSKIYRICVYIDGTNATNLIKQRKKANFYQISEVIQKHLPKYKQGDIRLFFDIVGEIKNNYNVELKSFISKFLFYFTSIIYNDSETFVIYDSVVRNNLPKYTKINKTNSDYSKYKAALQAIKDESGIADITLRDIELHIWYKHKSPVSMPAE